MLRGPFFLRDGGKSCGVYSGMKIHADLLQRVVVDSASLPWVDSPVPGVRRKMLERDGEEVARATSLVEYAPGSRFSAHEHGLGEEFLVLEGVFGDEHGLYPAGVYVRNPPGSRHAPFSEAGCVLFVKLRQFQPDDMRQCVIDTRSASWRGGPWPGVEVLELHRHGSERVALYRFAPGARMGRQSHDRGVELFVLEGQGADESGVYSAGTWLRLPPGGEHTLWSDTGCVAYIKTGHL